ncbi:MAG TPA: hypothetical protein VH476_12055 [Solirubrobacterales bacterium]
MIRWGRRLALLGVVVVALAAISATALGSGQTVKAGNLVVFVDGGFSPQKLPRTTPAPISLHAETTLKTADGTHPPAAKTLTLEFDKHAGINTTGLPTCSVERLENTLTKQAESICGDALVGTGEAGAEIAFPEQPPFFAKGKMLVFNGRPKNGHKVLIFHVYARVPAPTTFVTTAVITKATGIYGTKTEITIPTIVAGQGSLTFAKLRIKRDWTYKGKREHLLLATCPTGRFFTRGDLKFADGTEMKGKVLRSCSPIGG